MSEDVPIPGGIDALAGAAGLRETPDRSRFVPEITRLMFEIAMSAPTNGRVPGRVGLPRTSGARLSANLYAAARFQRALAALPTKTLSLCRRGRCRDAPADGGRAGDDRAAVP